MARRARHVLDAGRVAAPPPCYVLPPDMIEKKHWADHRVVTKAR